MEKFKKKLAILGGFALLCLLLLILSPMQSEARRPAHKAPPTLGKTAQSEHFGTRYIRHGLDVNDFRVPMTNYAIFGQFIELGAAGGEWPKGSNEFYIFGAGIWVGGTVNDRSLQTFSYSNAGTKRDTVLYGSITDPRVVIGYNPSGGAEEFSGLTNIFITGHPEDYADPDYWPLKDNEGNDIIVGIQDSYCEFDDQDVERWDTGVNSNAGDGEDIAQYGVGVKVIQRTHSWNYENNKTVHFFIFQVINIRQDKAPIRNCYVSVMCDADVGPTANDDLVGFDASRNLGYAYDSDFAEQGFARIPGFLAYKFLESPVANYDVDLNGDDQISDDSILINDVWVKDVKKGDPLGLTSFKTSNLQSGDPDTEPEKYIIMAGHNYPDVGDQRYAPFDLGTGTTPVDQRFFQSTGPFLLAPPGETVIDTIWAWDSVNEEMKIASIDTVVGDTVRVVVAVMMAPTLEELPQIADIAQSIYDIGFILPRPPDHPNVTVVPDDQKVYITWDDVAELTKDPYYGFTSDPLHPLYDPKYLEMDFEGYKLYRSPSGLPGTYELLASWDKSSVTPRHVSIEQLSGPTFEGTVSYDELNTEGYILAYGGTALFTGHEYLVQVKSDTSFSVSNLTLGINIPVSEEEDHWYYHGEPPYVFELFDADFWSRSDSAGVANGTHDKYFDGCNLLVGGMVINFTGDDSTYVPTEDIVFRIAGFAEAPEGENQELAHAYVDTGLINGMVYYYDVIAYDFQPFASPRSLENGITGIAVSPRSNVTGLSPANAIDVQHPSGVGDGSVTVEVVNPLEVTGHDYEVVFDDTTYSYTVWHLIDVTEGDTVLKDQANQAGDEDYLVVDGILVKVAGPALGVKSVAEVQNASGPVDPPDNLNYSLNSTRDWYMDPGGDKSFSRYSWNGATTHDYEIRFVEDATEYCWDWFGAGDYSYVATFQVPIEFWDIGIGTVDDPSDDVRITFMIIDDDGSNSFSWGDGLYIRDFLYDDVAWTTPDLSSDTYVSDFSDLHYGRFWFYDYSGELTRPDPGTVVRVLTNKVSTSADVFTFKTSAAVVEADRVNLDDIKVVPNPYIVRNAWEPSRDYSRIAFTHLPDKCTIRIYTISGDLIRTLEHESATFDGNENWDLLTKNNQKIAAGIYIYHIESDYGEKIGKFAVVR
jgi:hypothetical protein